MLRLARVLIARFGPKKPELTPAEQIEANLMELRGASPDELAGVLASTMLARKTLDTTRIVDVPFPSVYLDGTSIVDDAVRGELVAYVTALRQFQITCRQSENILSIAVARGLDMWIASINAIVLPDAVDKGRELWRLLLQGEKTIESAYRFITRRQPTEVDLSYMAYRPKLLLQA